MVGSWCPSMGTTGNVLPDRSGRNNHAVLIFDPPWQASPGGNKSGLAINFDGTGTYVEMAGVVKNLTADATISTWFLNKGNFTGYQTLFDCGAAFNATTRQLSVFLGGNTSQLFIATKGTAGGFVSLSAVMAVDTWTHLAMSQAGATTSIYINGAFSGSTTSASGSAFVEYPLRLAGNPTGGGANFVGLQDSVNIFNVALTPSEIVTLGKYRGVEHEAYSVPVVRGASVGAAPSGYGSVTAVGSLTGAASSVHSGSGQVSTVGAFTGSGLSVCSGAGSISAVGALSGAGLSVREGTGSVVGIGILTGVGDAPSDVVSGFGSILAIGTLSGTGQTYRSGSGALSGIARLAGAGMKDASGLGSITGVARLTGVGSDGEGSSSSAHFYYHYFLAN